MSCGEKTLISDMAEILYIKTADSSFIKLDEEILSRNFSVKSFLMNHNGKYNYFISLIKMKLFLLKNIRPAKIVFIRFCDYYAAIIAVFCKLFNRKFVIVVGGYDAVHIPKYKYGAYQNKLRGWLVKFAYNNANLILPNNPTLILNYNDYDEEISRYEGVKHFAPKTKAEFKVIYNGFKTEFWTNLQELEKDEKTVLTVAYINNLKTFFLKGIDKFIEMAGIFKDCKFIIAGMSLKFAEQNNISIPENVLLIGKTDQKGLLSYYGKAKVFCLLSLTEGMPNVLCEAMLCKCIPVGSRVNSIPEIIGDTGFVIDKKDDKLIEEALRKALLSPLSLGAKAQSRIIENFSFEKREKELKETLSKILKK